jgi:hypothetical protein
MRTSALGGIVFALVLAAMPGPAVADSVTGEVVDLSCYLSHPSTSVGASHRKCAETCAKKGLPMGVLSDDGNVVLLLEDHGNPKAYEAAVGKAAQTVTVEGKKVSQGGMPGIVVQSVQ